MTSGTFAWPLGCPSSCGSAGDPRAMSELSARLLGRIDEVLGVAHFGAGPMDEATARCGTHRRAGRLAEAAGHSDDFALAPLRRIAMSGGQT